MTQVAIVIPYYQTAPGILRRALSSIIAQDLPQGISLRVLVVDDASPAPASAEAAGLEAPGQVSVEIHVQPNGGPAAARNAALERLGPEAAFAAFLDSDDVWRPDHLRRALEALGAGADLYFCDVDEGDGRTWFERSAFGREVLEHGPRMLSGSEARSLILRDHPAHASSVVYRRERLAHARFRQELRNAGEDHLFWIALAAAAREVAVSGHVGAVRRNDGVNMFTGLLDWDNPGLLKVLTSILRKYRALEQDRTLAAADAELARARRRRSEDQIAFMILRTAARRPANLRSALASLDSDLGAARWLPQAFVRALADRALGRFELVF
ncbi:MAG: glycosyltransferase family A protein [Phenylobacterium sp.]|uniref:glycosyltransferase family A protein n=1 Tax=Phenylobacterium sp. TaxID=1871053 RepID=UPI00391BF6E6